ncbi:unnamed protein product [Symbiodinium natans]|uniref:Uncharacterized protein n=1 Tax=Symbiodinium natans TaxID=878477 RepID=A0A812HEN1_9DINO|nr:unnamed protein product [Symbiodinium natans]
MAEYSPVGLAIIAVIMACVLGLNAYFWKRFVDAEEVRQNLQDGTCEILSPEHYSSGWKGGWEFPITGPSWTDVPCTLQLKAKAGDVKLEGKTSLHFTYWQGIVWDYVQDSCKKLIPTKAEAWRPTCVHMCPHVSTSVEIGPTAHSLGIRWHVLVLLLRKVRLIAPFWWASMAASLKPTSDSESNERAQDGG